MNIMNKILLYIKNIKNKKLMAAWVICLVSVVLISIYYMETYIFFGIVDEKEKTINFEKPVIVQKIYCVTGQKIKAGDLLMELESHELDMRINAIKSELGQLKTQNNLTDVIKNEIGGRKSANSPARAKIEGLNMELGLLQSEKQRLTVHSDITGTVCSVKYSLGERIPPYKPVLTLCPESPALIIGYIQENLHSKVSLGQKVIVNSLTGDAREYEGKIDSIGSRVIQVPGHIKKILSMPLWAREVLITLPADNSFLAGEKVEIKVNKNVFLIQ
jgi:multidrug resistance efflux pump